MGSGVKNDLQRRTDYGVTPQPAPTPRVDVGEAGPVGGPEDRPAWLERGAYAERGDGDPAARDGSSQGNGSFRGLGSGRGASPALRSLNAADAPARGNSPGIGAGNRRGSPGVDAADGPGGQAMTRERARELIDGAMRLSASSSDSDDYVRNNITPEVLAHATPAEKAHMLRCLMDGPTGADDERAMGMILRSVRTPEELNEVLRQAGGAEAVWDELDSARGSVIDHFRSLGEPGARMILAIADGLPSGSSLSDDFVRDHVDRTVLAQASNAQKAHMLRCLMDGPTGADDERAMLRVLESVRTPDDMMEVLRGAGGTEAVLDELDGERAHFMDGLRARGDTGHEIIARMAASFDVASSQSDDFVRDHVDARVLARATPEQKAHMLRCLMDGPTGEDDEQAMLRVLQSVRTPAEMSTVLRAAGGAGAVWSELEGQQQALIAHLRTQGADGQQMLGDLALALPVAERAAIATQLRRGVTAADQPTLQRIVDSARDPVELAILSGLNSEQVGLVREAYQAHRNDAAFVNNLTHLLRDGGFTQLSADTQTAVLSQVRNYPDARSVHNLERLVQKPWFTGMTLADQQRSAAVVAFISQHPGDRTLIDNTLDRFLSPGAPYTFDWNKTGDAYGSAGGSTFHFNRRYLDAGNGRVNTGNDDTMHMVTHTVAHEVSHLVNNDHVAATQDYFMGEYRAFFVGFRAQHGRDPTRAEMLGRVRHLLTDTDEPYNQIRLALADPVEGPRIVTFMQQLLGRADVTQANAADLPAVDPNHAAPVPPGDLDN